VKPSNLTLFYQGSTTGAIDVVAVRDSQGNLSCSPFHVKLNKPAQKGDCCRIVKLTVNSKDVALSMKIGSAGEAFFVERTNLKSLSRNPVHPVTNSSGFEQGTTPKNTALQIPQQHSLFVTTEVNGNTTR
jgi:phosphatidate phosphatase LPIN